MHGSSSLGVRIRFLLERHKEHFSSELKYLCYFLLQGRMRWRRWTLIWPLQNKQKAADTNWQRTCEEGGQRDLSSFSPGSQLLLASTIWGAEEWESQLFMNDAFLNFWCTVFQPRVQRSLGRLVLINRPSLVGALQMFLRLYPHFLGKSALIQGRQCYMDAITGPLWTPPWLVVYSRAESCWKRRGNQLCHSAGTSHGKRGWGNAASRFQAKNTILLMCSAARGRQEGLQNQEVNVERFQTPPGRIPWDVRKARSMALISLTSFTFTLGRDPRTVQQKEEPQHVGLTAARLLSNVFIVPRVVCVSGAFRKPSTTYTSWAWEEIGLLPPKSAAAGNEWTAELLFHQKTRTLILGEVVKKEKTIEASQKWRNWEKITLLKTGLLRRRNDEGRAEYRPHSLEKPDR